MANLLKKVVVLSLLLLAVFAVYLAKNGEIREELFIRLGLAASKDFKIPEDIKIDLSDIDMDSLAIESAPEEVEERNPFEEGIGATSEEAWEDEVVIVEKKMSLEEIEEKVKEIAQQVDKIKKEVEIIVAMDKIQQDIEDLASQCSDCNILSSI